MTLFNNIISYRHLEMLRTVFCAAFIMLLSILFAGWVSPAGAQEVIKEVLSENLTVSDSEAAQIEASYEDPYIVEDIDVDVTAGNAVKAREQAFEAAQIKGYEMLAARLLPSEKLAAFETPDINTVSFLVQDYEVTAEKLSATRYKGTYKIRYSKKAFSDSTMQAGDMAQGSVLILPFYEAEGRSVLWQGNPFMEAWRRALGNGLLNNIVLPVGDIEDISQINETQALSYNPADLSAMRMRYHVTEIMILQAIPEVALGKTQGMSVNIYKVKRYGPELVKKVIAQIYPGEIQGQFYNRVVNEVRKSLRFSGSQSGQIRQGQSLGQSANQSQYGAVRASPYFDGRHTSPPALMGAEKTILAEVRFGSMREWVRIKKSLEQVYGVKMLRVKSFSPQNTVIDLTFQIAIRDLRAALRQRGLVINDPVVQQYDETEKALKYIIYSVGVPLESSKFGSRERSIQRDTRQGELERY